MAAAAAASTVASGTSSWSSSTPRAAHRLDVGVLGGELGVGAGHHDDQVLAGAVLDRDRGRCRSGTPGVRRTRPTFTPASGQRGELPVAGRVVADPADHVRRRPRGCPRRPPGWRPSRPARATASRPITVSPRPGSRPTATSTSSFRLPTTVTDTRTSGCRSGTGTGDHGAVTTIRRRRVVAARSDRAAGGCATTPRSTTSWPTSGGGPTASSRRCTGWPPPAPSTSRRRRDPAPCWSTSACGGGLMAPVRRARSATGTSASTSGCRGLRPRPASTACTPVRGSVAGGAAGRRLRRRRRSPARSSSTSRTTSRCWPSAPGCCGPGGTLVLDALAARPAVGADQRAPARAAARRTAPRPARPGAVRRPHARCWPPPTGWVWTFGWWGCGRRCGRRSRGSSAAASMVTMKPIRSTGSRLRGIRAQAMTGRHGKPPTYRRAA